MSLSYFCKFKDSLPEIHEILSKKKKKEVEGEEEIFQLELLFIMNFLARISISTYIWEELEHFAMWCLV